FVFGGIGDPPAPQLIASPADVLPEQIVELGAFAIDRTEVTNAAFAVATGTLTGIKQPAYPNARGFELAASPTRPVAGVTWIEARAFCAHLGKRLPTSAQWQKALRGGLVVDGVPNPHPRRTLPWGGDASAARLALVTSAHEVGTTPDDRSPYGVLDLAANVQEWTRSLDDEATRQGSDNGMRVTRGGQAVDMPADDLLYYVASENQRPAQFRAFSLGFRCVTD
ncbi:MAG: SUMF1/EgtB/PvdO family nonheme iron enzyme, partial [Proteobacteria bacterium]|nr:SUMF1/EgtB/PvdO family nonheme iron enzyme [Pseudomonadota bacterium]